ncbi:MAG TPA: hypothetical protein VGZ47_05670 [Gemmataceae bacterium]|jgi:hypothetical protein|nr:hypothetical protein [Gemmataceae bacterium]
MSKQKVKLIDSSRNIVAIAEVARRGDHFAGTVDLRNTPNSVLSLFEEFEEVVNGQVFSAVDDIEARIGALQIKAAFESNGALLEVSDLQVFPRAGKVSFKMAKPASSQAGSSSADSRRTTDH